MMHALKTEDDVCSMECKGELLELQAARVKMTARVKDISFSAPSTPSGALQLPAEITDVWDYKKNRYNYRHTSLSTFRWYAYRITQYCRKSLVFEDIRAPSEVPFALTREGTH